MKHIIEDFLPMGGKHCITGSLRQIFTYYDHPVSEEMLFGVASGLSFLYINQLSSPMINGRTKVFEFEEKLAERLNISIKCRAGKDDSRILQKTKKMINSGTPVLVYADMPCLKYLGLDANSHFGGHAVVLFGYDDEAGKFWVSDRDSANAPINTPHGEIAENYHLVGYDELKKARSSAHRPFPAKNKYLEFDFSGYREIDRCVLKDAISETCSTMLDPPAQLLGISGILKFSKEILKWRKFSPDRLRLAGTVNYFQIHRDGGTGGGLFRRMYGIFLMEAAPFLHNEQLHTAGLEFIKVSDLWDDLADSMWRLSLTGDPLLLKDMSASILYIYNIEKNLYETLKEILKSSRP